ncbi:cobalamin-dependent protein [Micromonospora sp. NPDC049374]|uniref:cobalamin-dependent protein n=1 Tax=unclassified Micromonospora TaxID=2617518 RepID=UPI003446B49D
MSSRKTQRTVIIGVARSDAHAVANHLIAMRLREAGFCVVNLGVCTPLEDFAEALVAHPDAEAVLIGSLNGHAYEDLRDLPALRAAGRLHCPLIVGGNLSVGSHKDGDERERLLSLGVDHILDEADQIPLLLDLLHAARATPLTGV